MVAMGLIQFPKRVLGVEGAGVIKRVGSQVKNLKIGDRVAIIERYMCATTIVTLEILCLKVPDDMGFDVASTMFFPFATAMYSLMNVGGMTEGQVSVTYFLIASVALTDGYIDSTDS